jgi:hypothetical protein
MEEPIVQARGALGEEESSGHFNADVGSSSAITNKPPRELFIAKETAILFR